MTAKRRLVVVGNGMAGARLVEEVLTRGGGARHQITVFGDEPHGNYNRILLSSVLARSHDPKSIFINPLPWYAANGVTLHAGVRVESVDVRAQEVFGANGTVAPYDTLVIATGSRPLIPPIDGLSASATGSAERRYRGTSVGFKRGVFVFRTLDDCERILGFANRVQRAAVIGGGLLGLEAARGLVNAGLDVHVIHLNPHLMETQLDGPGAQVLRQQLEQMGVHVHLGKTTTAVLGDREVSGLAFNDGSTLACEMVILAAGIRPNVELAAAAGLRVRRGIVVGDDLTCDGEPAICAIGECAEHRGRVYGLVAPLWEQAAVLADRLSGKNPAALYPGSKPSTKLKVAGVDLAVMGDKDPVEEDDEVITYAEPSRGVYKKLIVRNHRLAGAIVLGDGAIVPSLVRLFSESSVVPGNRSELLFRGMAVVPTSAAAIADVTQICNCNGVTKAQILEAVLQGACTVRGVSEATRACTGCGSCRPEVQAIVDLACQGLTGREVLAAAGHADDLPEPPPVAGQVVVTHNKIERYKSEKDGLDVVDDIPRFAEAGWQAIDEGDRERLKWAGVFFRRQTPGRFMMRVRISNGMTNAAQLNALAQISTEFGAGFADITTRQQIQLRGYGIEHTPEILTRLDAVGLVTLQTGQDNIRNVVGCPVAGFTRHELFDASPIVREFTESFLRNREFTNLPRKFNVVITGCTEHCTHAESQDLALTPAVKRIDGEEVKGFNVMAGGKMGSGGFRAASALDVFVPPGEAVELCRHVTLIFRDHGSRAARNKARLAFLIDAWGVARFRAELQRRVGRPLLTAGHDKRGATTTDHLGIGAQPQAGLNYVGLAVPVGRIGAEQLFDVARLAERYGTGDVRLTTGQNLIIPNVPDDALSRLRGEPLLDDFPVDPPGVIRGLVSCTGIDYCHMALIETKELALKTARHLEQRSPGGKMLTMHWSGCPAGCGNHAAADIGLLGKNARINGEIVDAVDVFVGGRSGPNARPGTKLLEDVPCDELPHVLERLIPYLSGKRSMAVTAPKRSAESELAIAAHVIT